MEHSKTQALAYIRSTGQYVEDKLSTAFIQKAYKGEKKLLTVDVLNPVDIKLLNFPFVNGQLLYDKLCGHSSWSLYLPDKYEEVKAFVWNLMNSCSGMAAELMLEDIINTKKELQEKLKAYDNGNQGQESLEVDANAEPVEQYKQQRCLSFRERHRKQNGYKLSKKTIKLTESKEVMHQKAEGRLVRWKEGDSQDLLMNLINIVFEPRFDNKITMQITDVDLFCINDDKFRVRATVEFRHTTLIEPSQDERLTFYLSKCSNALFVNQKIATLKAKVRRLKKYYTFPLHSPAVVTQKVKVTQPAIVSENVEMLSQSDLQCYIQAQISKQMDRSRNLQPTEKRSNVSLIEYERLLEVSDNIVCPACFQSPPGKYFMLFQCNDVICSRCYSLSLVKKCPTCAVYRLLTKRGLIQNEEDYKQEQERRKSSHSNQIGTIYSLDDAKVLLHHYQKVFKVDQIDQTALLMENQELTNQLLDLDQQVMVLNGNPSDQPRSSDQILTLQEQNAQLQDQISQLQSQNQSQQSYIEPRFTTLQQENEQLKSQVSGFEKQQLDNIVNMEQQANKYIKDLVAEYEQKMKSMKEAFEQQQAQAQAQTKAIQESEKYISGQGYRKPFEEVKESQHSQIDSIFDDEQFSQLTQISTKLDNVNLNRSPLRRDKENHEANYIENEMSD